MFYGCYETSAVNTGRAMFLGSNGRQELPYVHFNRPATDGREGQSQKALGP